MGIRNPIKTTTLLDTFFRSWYLSKKILFLGDFKSPFQTTTTVSGAEFRELGKENFCVNNVFTTMLLRYILKVWE